MLLGVCLIAPSVFGHHSTAEYSDVDVREMTSMPFEALRCSIRLVCGEA